MTIKYYLKADKNSAKVGSGVPIAKMLLAVIYFLFLSQIPLYAGNFKNIEILIEENKEYTIRDLLKEATTQFVPFNKGNIIQNKKSFWARFVYEKGDPQKVYYLTYPYILNRKLDLYFFVGDSLHHYHTGVAMEFGKRNFYLPSLTLELPTSNIPTVCWLHFQGHDNFPFFFSEAESKSVIRDEIYVSNIEFFLIGLSFLAGVFSLIFLFFLKDRLYLYYSLFSFMLIISRLTLSGYIFNYIAPIYQFQTLKSILNLYAISYLGINLALVFYFHEFLRIYNSSRWYTLTVYGWVLIRVIFLIIHLYSENPIITAIVDNRFLDLFIQIFLLGSIFKTPKKDLRSTVLAACSLVILIVGNLIIISPDLLPIINGRGYYFFLNLAGVEVFVFAVTMAYRHFYLKKEHDMALLKMVQNLKESEQLKDNLNKELEIKVNERTKQIQENNQQIKEMYELLKTHNIALKSEVNDANEARVFQKIMNFQDFQRIFPDENACYRYLANLKWKKNEKLQCKKCGYEVNPNYQTFVLRCGKCGYLESVTSGTLFQRLRFPILKCFYITYRTSNKNDSTTIAELAEELEIRPATLWTFRQKVIALRDAFTGKKKHKDGWTHLIENSISKGKQE
ncbi:MAG TPA: 7TM diverse intracellular signaling domain-containing protein [Cytophagaceae bacterium]|jgi:hypothetical protein